MQFVGRGLTLLVTDSKRIVVNNPIFNWLGSGQWNLTGLVIPKVIVLLIPIILLAVWCVNNLNFGTRLYAAGGNERAAAASGINVSRFKLLIYTLTGLLCGLAAIVTIGRSNSAQPLSGTDLEFTVITAVVLGGTSLLGGVGTMTGTLCGCLLMGIITFSINMINIPPYWNYIIKGIFVMIAVLSDQTLELLKDAFKYTTAGKELPAGSGVGEREFQSFSQGKNHTLELKGIGKSFPGVKVLNNVDITIKSGRVHALLGENGAGKSTLIKILSGVYQKDEGQIIIDGIPVEIHSTIDARKLGISVIYQEFALIPELNVMQNIFLGREIRRWRWFLNIAFMRKRAAELMGRLKFNADITRKIRSFSVSQQQMIEISKAFGADAWLVVMDEPTSAITEANKEQLFEVVREMKAAGMAIIYISHRLEEIFEIADDITVLRDGEHIKTLPVGETDENILTKLMVGREITNIFTREKNEPGEVIFKVEGLRRGGAFEPISFEVRAGEVLGLSGLMGAGRTEVARCIFGLDKADGGIIWLNGQKLSIRSPGDALRYGICYVSEDRRNEGIIPLRSVKENVCLAALKSLSQHGRILFDRQSELYEEYREKFNIKAVSDKQQIGKLSGGNQQKCCLAKMLACRPKLLILDEPTRGIDVGAKAEIHKLIEQLAKQNIAIILISSEMLEIMGASDRILVLAEGRMTGEFDGGSVTQEEIMTSAIQIVLPVANPSRRKVSN
jgi:ribose transport system ATP-binding protein